MATQPGRSAGGAPAVGPAGVNRRMTAAILAGAALVGSMIAAPRAAHAKPKPPPGNLIFVQKGAIWRVALATPEEPVKLIKLPPMRKKRVTRLEAAGDGSALLVELSKNAAWIDLSGPTPAAPVYLPCRGRAHLSPGGERVLCASRTGKGTSVYRLRPTFGAAPLAASPGATLMADLTGERVIVAEPKALFLTPVASPDHRTQVAPHAPSASLSIAPDGQRAVGRYSDGDGAESLYGFRLDGEAARRKLGPGTPVGWSADSVWLAVNGENTACAVRAVGGEFKCWDKFRTLAIDRDGSWLLLARPPGAKARRFDLFLGRVGGPHVEKPLPLLRGVSAAVLVP